MTKCVFICLMKISIQVYCEKSNEIRSDGNKSVKSNMSTEQC